MVRPLAELHCHLEGAVPPALAIEKATKHGTNIDDLITPDSQSYRWSDFTSFLSAYDRVAALFLTEEDQFDLAYAHFSALSSQGAIYAEVFISPDHMGGQQTYPAFLDALIAGYRKARSETGIEGRFIPIAVRNLGPEAALAVARLVVAHPRAEVTGFGLAGDERLFTPAEFTPAFLIAKDAGLGCTAHAGELCGPESISQALEFLPVRRIGHGVRAVEEPNLVRQIADDGIVLEVCPGSNIALGLYKDYSLHPLRHLRDAGVRVTLNSDDPPFFRTNLRHEYDMAADVLGFTPEELVDMTQTAIDAAFVDRKTKDRLLRAILG